MVAFVFPGQGAQRRGIGADLFDTVDEFVRVEREIDDLLGYSLRTLCLEDPDNRLDQTRYTQPAMFVVNALYYYRSIAQGARPDIAAGHSLGEYNALLAAGAFDLLTGLRLVQKRGELMSEVVGGGMVAVIGLREARIVEILAEHELEQLDVANLNAPLQIILAGPRAEIDRAVEPLEHAGARHVHPLPVSAPFHSRYMDEPARRFGEFLSGFSFNKLSIPVISNVTALPYPEGAAATDGDRSAMTRALLTRQITHPVRWLQTVRYLTDREQQSLTEIGPGNVLTKLEAQINQRSRRIG